jgi:predicted RNA-binding protein
LDQTKVLGAEKQQSFVIRSVNANDKIILVSTLNIGNKPTICFIGYTMVDKTYEDKKSLYKTYKAKKKLKLKGIKYFSEPIVAKDLANELKFVTNPKKSASYFKSEYKEIGKTDFEKILRTTSFTKICPIFYSEEVSFTKEEFLLKSIKALQNILKRSEKRNQVEIIFFIKLLREYLSQFDIKMSYEDLEIFYGTNAWKLGFRHTPSRDPDKFVVLYNQNGRKNNLSYISLE